MNKVCKISGVALAGVPFATIVCLKHLEYARVEKFKGALDPYTLPEAPEQDHGNDEPIEAEVLPGVNLVVSGSSFITQTYIVHFTSSDEIRPLVYNFRTGSFTEEKKG